ncbi:hypothetical protein CLV40_12467 [Actinokineospora auranticolor]|uniref:Peptidase inhibitor family I36 n=2 Tax=Actinokineospora auranticolor TaxID=155976 RepID=A0A2S6GF17_9PSEU|nr:hypothetical protein CLV40_12467 [Actinokineospora auranticolor]
MQVGSELPAHVEAECHWGQEMKYLRRAAVSVALFSLVAVVFAPSASADTGKRQVRNCVVQADVVSVNGVPVEGPKVPHKPVCFDTIGAGLVYATGGAISAESAAGVDTPAKAGALVEAAEGKTGAGALAVVIGLFYDSNNYGGGTILTITTSTGCSPTLGFGTSYVGDYANDDIASGKSFSSCKHKVWEDAYYWGANYGWTYGTSGYGLLDEEISSIEFSY